MNGAEQALLERRLRRAVAGHQPNAPDELIRLIDTVPVEHRVSRTLFGGVAGFGGLAGGRLRHSLIAVATAAAIVVGVVGGAGLGFFRNSQHPSATRGGPAPSQEGSPFASSSPVVKETPTATVPMETPTAPGTTATDAPIPSIRPSPTPTLSSALTPPDSRYFVCSTPPTLRLASGLDGVGNWSMEAFAYAAENHLGHGMCRSAGVATGPHVAVLAMCDTAQTLAIGIHAPRDPYDMDPPQVASFNVSCPVGPSAVVYDATISGLAGQHLEVHVSGPTVDGGGMALGRYELLVQTTDS